jgi:methyltransferase (TIGR00027 family)
MTVSSSGTASQTALGAALYRAAHQLCDHPRVFDDPLALPIVGGDAEAATERWTGAAVAGLRAFLAVRSRATEDAFAEARARGVRTYVVLGAGLDTFGYRTALDADVVELDHPATQAWKRARLAAAGIAVPPRVRHVAIDFEREALGDVLDRLAIGPAFFAWLGVTPYLTREATRATLEAIARRPGREVMFDFLVPGQRAQRAALAARTAAVGEPLRNEVEPDELARELAACGFARSEIADHAQLQARYLAGRADGLALRGGHLAHAWT